ncbi:translation initiation factor IF-3 [Candidatus Azambacteria bacterium]|nr:translation initiation factor IF-3 [Candidatus Azambacteria bacterium]MBI3685431.1 translation initiation factor IF-3 [Candidatus Azambacteria bacterium]
MGSTPTISTKTRSAVTINHFKTILKRPRLNNQIRALKVRLIDDAGENLGVVDIQAALEMAHNKKLDLVEIAPTAQPPVVKITDYGKYLYQAEKQERKQKARQKVTGMKSVKIGLSTSAHDSLTKIKQLEGFLEEGHKVKIEIFLRGRERANPGFAQGRFKKFLSLIQAPHKIEQPIKKIPSGFLVVISKQ